MPKYFNTVYTILTVHVLVSLVMFASVVQPQEVAKAAISYPVLLVIYFNYY